VFQKKIIFVFVLLAATTVLGLLGIKWYSDSQNPVFPESTSQVNFTIAENESAGSILTRLENSRVIKSALAARIYLKITGKETRLSPGTYNLNQNVSLSETLSQLFAGPKNIRITLPEGWRREQIAARIASSLDKSSTKFNAQEFVDKTATLEGQLYPDTYLVPPDITTTEFIALLQKTYSQKTGLDQKTPDHRETLILASLVERETNNDKDRPVVAGILKKRLRSSWPLQIDASIQYASDTTRCGRKYLDCDWWEPITDTKFPSDYNTYEHLGLPPAPICNPGLASIEAVRKAVDTQYWFYITGNDGVTYYAETLSEHNRNIDKYLRP
jgi:UPF0755 protein